MIGRRMILALVAVAALAGRAWALSPEEARHLLTRAGFGASPAEIAALAPLTREQAVDGLLAGARTVATQTPPAWIDQPPPDTSGFKALSEEERMAKYAELRRIERQRAEELKGWWWREMAVTDSPLSERMTLAWHNHFTSSMQKVRRPQEMYRQNILLREEALGNFGELVRRVTIDPAMVIYLDTQSNRKGKPNENYARELLELFTLGEGNYTETDIKEAARALTGIQVDRRQGTVIVRPALHDAGEKTFMGVTGNLDADGVVEVILKQPRCAEHVTEKLWRELVSPEPDAAEVKRLAAAFRKNYEIAPLVRELLLSEAFWATENRGSLIKSPADLLVGAVRSFGVPVADGRMLSLAGRRLGQDLMDPPNVKGWPGQERWIDTNTLLARREVLERMLRGAEQARRKARVDTPAANRMVSQRQAGTRLQQRLAAAPPEMRARMQQRLAAATPGDRVRMEGQTVDRVKARIEAAQAARQGDAMDAMAMEGMMEGPSGPAPPMSMEGAKWGPWQKVMLTEGGVPAMAAMLVPLVPTQGLPAETEVQPALRALLMDPVYQLK